MEGGKCFIGLEIGNSKVAAVAGIQDQSKMKILAFTEKPISEEVIKVGKVVNIETTSNSINEVLDEIVAQINNLDYEIDLQSVNINICDQDIISQSGKLSVVGSEGINRIRKEDVERLFNDAIAGYTPPAGYRLLHCLPKEFYVNSEVTSGTLIGKFGNQLGGDFNYIATKDDSLNNLIDCVNQVQAKGSIKGNFQVENVYLNQIADSSTLLDFQSGGIESKRDGVAIVNIGAAFTEISAYKDGGLRHHALIPIAGNTINQDLMKAFDISFSEAESLKKVCSSIPIVFEESPVVIIKRKHGMKPVEIFLKNAITIIEWRLKEIITLIKAELENSKVGHNLRSGIILTGGTSNFVNIKELFDLVSKDFNIRDLVFPELVDFSGFEQLESPKYTTLLGLILSPLNNYDYRIEDTRMLTPRPIDNKIIDMEEEVEEESIKDKFLGRLGKIGDMFKKESNNLNDGYNL